MGGKIDYPTLATHHRAFALKVRSQNTMIQSDMFATVWKRLTAAEQEEVMACIQEVNIQKLRFLLYGDGLSSRELRAIAQNNHVTNYSRMSKEGLTILLKSKDLI